MNSRIPYLIPKISLRKTAEVFVVLLILCVSLYYRSYALLMPGVGEDKGLRKRAEVMVKDMIRKQIQTALSIQLPQMPEDQRNKLTNERLKQAILSEPKQFEAVINQMLSSLTEARKSHYSSKYLSGADSYYYYGLTRNILERGRLGPPGPGGTFYNPKRHAPFGNWDRINLHPYLGLWTYQVLRLFKPGISLMKAVGTLPLFLTVLVIVAFLFLCHTMRVGFLSAILGCLTMSLSPIWIQRSTFGWYDTDPYNVLFPILILTTYFASFRHPSRKVILGIVGGALTGFYGLFWQGWSFILYLVAFAALLIGFLDRITGKERTATAFQYLSVYLPCAILCSVVVLSPSEFMKSMGAGFSFVQRAGASSASLWPNLMIMIGETNAVPFKNWVFLVSNEVTVAVMAVGIIGTGFFLTRRGRTAEFKQWLVLLLMFLPLGYLSLKSNRSTLLVILPATLFVVLGIERIKKGLGKLGPLLIKGLNPKVYSALSVLALLLLIVPRTLVGADVAGHISHTIMNETWNAALKEIRGKTPPDSLVFSWWAPGHFVTGVAERKVVVDGGTHHYEENYWIAKALMSNDEKAACGIFRMLATSGNKAVDFLTAQGLRLEEAVRLLLGIVGFYREEAKGLLPASWTDRKKEQLLYLTHGMGLPTPSYVMIFDDLMQKNVMLQILSRWDFDKAQALFQRKEGLGEKAGFLGGNATKNYVNQMIGMTGPILFYQEEARLARRQGNLLLFENDVIIDRAAKRAFLQEEEASGAAKTGAPIHLIYKDGGRWIAKWNPQSPRPIAVILIPAEQSFKSVLAHGDLIPTLLFQFYYLEGSHLRYFKPFIFERDPLTGTNIRIFEIDWQSFVSERMSPPSESSKEGKGSPQAQVRGS